MPEPPPEGWCPEIVRELTVETLTIECHGELIATTINDAYQFEESQYPHIKRTKEEAAQELPEEPLFDIWRCRVCGCTDEHACPDGCYWVEEDLCSACDGKAESEG